MKWNNTMASNCKHTGTKQTHSQSKQKTLLLNCVVLMIYDTDVDEPSFC